MDGAFLPWGFGSLRPPQHVRITAAGCYGVDMILMCTTSAWAPIGVYVPRLARRASRSNYKTPPQCCMLRRGPCPPPLGPGTWRFPRCTCVATTKRVAPDGSPSDNNDAAAAAEGK